MEIDVSIQQGFQAELRPRADIGLLLRLLIFNKHNSVNYKY